MFQHGWVVRTRQDFHNNGVIGVLVRLRTALARRLERFETRLHALHPLSPNALQFRPHLHLSRRIGDDVGSNVAMQAALPGASYKGGCSE